jgi:cytochrome P450
LPLLGHLPRLARDPLALLSSLPRHGDLVRLRVGRTDAVVVCTPELTEQVLRDDRTFDKGGFLVDRARESLGDGVGTCVHAKHRRQRRLVQPAFHSSRLPAYGDAMARQAVAMVESWQEGQVLDVVAELMRFTSSTLVATMFSDGLPPAVLRQAVDDVETVVNGGARRMLLPPPLDRLPTPANRRHHRAIARLRATVGGIIAARREGGDRSDDLMSLLLDARDGDARLTDTELMDQAITFFVAGTDTVATTLAWVLYDLARHPDVEERLHTEVDEELAGETPRYDHVHRLALTGRVVTESLRLRSPAWLFTRTTTTDTELGGHAIPAGTTVVYSQYLLHHRQDLYPEPETFQPDRWLACRDPQPPHGAFIAFGGGARKCAGDRFGLAEASIALAAIAARWRLRPLPGRDVRPALSGVLRPRDLRMRIVARHPASVSQA